MIKPSFECPVCHGPLMGSSEVCNGSFTERDHPSGVKAVVAKPKEPSPDRWVNAVVTFRVPLSVDPGASDEEKLNAAVAISEERFDLGQDTVSEIGHETVEG